MAAIIYETNGGSNTPGGVVSQVKTVKTNGIIRCKKAENSTVDASDPIYAPLNNGEYERSYEKWIAVYSAGTFNTITNPCFYTSGNTGTGTTVLTRLTNVNSNIIDGITYYSQNNTSLPLNYSIPVIPSNDIDTINITNFTNTAKVLLTEDTIVNANVIMGGHIVLYMRVDNTAPTSSPTSNLILYFSWDQT